MRMGVRGPLAHREKKPCAVGAICAGMGIPRHYRLWSSQHWAGASPRQRIWVPGPFYSQAPTWIALKVEQGGNYKAPLGTRLLRHQHTAGGAKGSSASLQSRDDRRTLLSANGLGLLLVTTRTSNIRKGNSRCMDRPYGKARRRRHAPFQNAHQSMPLVAKSE